MKQKQFSLTVKVALILGTIVTALTGVKLLANHYQDQKTAQTIAEISQKYPATKTNQSALKLEELIVPLGLRPFRDNFGDVRFSNFFSQ